MEGYTALECYASAIKVDGQLDLLLSLLAQISSLCKNGELQEDVRDGIRKIILTCLDLVRNETKNALQNTKQREFQSIMNNIDDAISLAEKDEYSAAGTILAVLTLDPHLLVNRARDILESKKRDWIF